jgi:hypothetical protein
MTITTAKNRGILLHPATGCQHQLSLLYLPVFTIAAIDSLQEFEKTVTFGRKLSNETTQCAVLQSPWALSDKFDSAQA